MKTKILNQIHARAIFRDATEGPWICATELRKRIDVPKDCSKIRLVLTKDQPDNDGWYRLNNVSFDTPLRGIRSLLTHNLKMWLAEGKQEGYHYGFIDYLS